VDPTNKPLVVEIGGEERELYFNLNTFSAFEDVTQTDVHPDGKRFFEILKDLGTAYLEAQSTGDAGGGLAMMAKLSLRDIRALVWSAWHTYPDPTQDTPEWPYTLHQVGRMITMADLPRLLPLLMERSFESMPDEAEVRPSLEETTAVTNEPQSSPPGVGGVGSGPTDVEHSASRSTDSGE
jgi:hypothetical protein